MNLEPKSYMDARYFDVVMMKMFFCGKVVKTEGRRFKIMKSTNVKCQTAKVLANISLKFGKVSADSACAYIFHQPKMPNELKELKKKRI